MARGDSSPDESIKAHLIAAFNATVLDYADAELEADIAEGEDLLHAIGDILETYFDEVMPGPWV